MARKLIRMCGEEFIQKMVNGERNFSRVELPKGTDLTKLTEYNNMNDLLKKRSLKEYKRDAIILEYTSLVGLIAHNIWLPSADFSHADLSNSDFSSSFLRRANFAYANVSGVNFFSAELSRADFFNANLSNSSLRKASLSRTNFAHTKLYKADLRDAKDFNEAMNFQYAFFI